MMGNYWYGNNGASNAWGGIFMILLVILIALGIFLAIRYANQKGENGTPTKEDDAVTLLKKRYANSEIDKREYEQKLKDLTK